MKVSNLIIRDKIFYANIDEIEDSIERRMDLDVITNSVKVPIMRQLAEDLCINNQ